MKYSALMVSLGAQRSYPIEIFAANLDQIGSTFGVIPSARNALIVTNTVVEGYYLSVLKKGISENFQRIFHISLEDGEAAKNWNSLNKIYDVLLHNECDRNTVIFALGGGVVGDMAGFAAATFMRGIPFVQVPTTLLAQVDSSVGGKTAINHPLGKNMIGAFYQPQLVVCDLASLDTLPAREVSAGLAEIIKYGPIADMAFFEWLEAHIDALRRLEPTAVMHAVKRSVEIKAWVVGQDEKEAGLRAILNFGHTFGHAIEAGMGYGNWLHGEGVGAGMVMAAHLSQRLGLVDASFVDRLTLLIARAGLPTRGAVIDATDNAGAYLEHMRVDKKAQAGEIRFVLIDGLGNATIRSAPDSLVREVIDACCMQGVGIQG